MKRPTTICALTENRPGVLARIAGLFSRRGFNLLSVTAEEAENPDVYCITLVVEEDDAKQKVDGLDVAFYHAGQTTCSAFEMKPEGEGIARSRGYQDKRGNFCVSTGKGK